MAGLCIVLDRIEDRGNRAAVLRSAEALGILNVHEVAPTDPERGRARGVGGAGEKWLNIHVHANAASCRAALPDAMLLAALPPVPEVAASVSWHETRDVNGTRKRRRQKRAPTDVDDGCEEPAAAAAAAAAEEAEEAEEAEAAEAAVSSAEAVAGSSSSPTAAGESAPPLETTAIELLDFGKPTALIFGNERFGVSAEMQSLCDGAFYIPLHGLTESLNVSVACAVSMHYGRLARANALRAKGCLNAHGGDMSDAEVAALCDEYASRGKHHSKGPK